MADRRGLLIILSSPSGAGKSTLAKRLMKWDPELEFSVSATTRAPRLGEEHGREYYFLSEDEFKQQVADGQMLEHAHVFGNFYGSPAVPCAHQSPVAGTFCSMSIGKVRSKSAIRSLANMHYRSSFCPHQSESFAVGWKRADKTAKM